MSINVRLTLLAVLSGLIATSCASPISITKPTPTTGPVVNPLTPIELTFDANYDPGKHTWGVRIDPPGVHMSKATFSPTPTPNSTISAPLIFPPSASDEYTLVLAVGCGGFCFLNSQDVKVRPPKLNYNHTQGSVVVNLKQSQPTPVFVGVAFSPTIPVVVTVQETSTPPRVNLQLPGGAPLPPGAPLNVTIPAGQTKGNFVITGQTLGLYTLTLNSPGTKPGAGSGTTTTP